MLDLYQKAIEYYSAIDNDQYTEYLNRMTKMFQDENISRILSQDPSTQNSDSNEEEKKD